MMNLVSKAWHQCYGFALLPLLASVGFSDVVDIYHDATTSQSKFAAQEIQSALQVRDHSGVLKPMSAWTPGASNPNIVLGLATDNDLSGRLGDQDGTIPEKLGEQAYGLRTTSKDTKTYWVMGGDPNGLMYGGLQLAENIRFNGLAGTYNSQEEPYIKSRGVKYNLPLDARTPTYVGYGNKTLSQAFKGDAMKEAIPAVWDMDYWEGWFDEMARARFNVIAIWNSHPFPALLDMEEAIPDVQGFKGYARKMSTADKVAFWKKVMAYGKGRGFQFYFITWNIYTYGAEGKGGINNDPKNQATKDYFRKAVRTMFETYPDLSGLGVTAGENMNGLSAEAEGEWMWDTYGRGMLDFAREHPERDITFIHRWHYAEISQVMKSFAPLLELPNVRLDMSYKYSAAHMYSAPAPRLIYTKDGDVPADLEKTNKKTWLEVRQDDFYFLHWGDPSFARAYINAFPDKDKYIQGFFYGGDGWTSTRDFYSKDDVYRGELEIKRMWYTQRIWGRLSYNPEISDEVFIGELASRYPKISAESLFNAWHEASRGLPLAAEVIQGSLCFDFHWWPELCQSAKGFLTIDDFIKAKPSIGSDIVSIADSAAGKNPAGRTSYKIADQVEAAGMAALKELALLSPGGDPELEINLKSIHAQAYLSLYLAEKIRGATAKAADKKSEARTAMGNAVEHWSNYVEIMDQMFTGMKMLRTRDFKDWHVHDGRVTKEYTDLGGPMK